jgi:hypothetical protein
LTITTAWPTVGGPGNGEELVIIDESSEQAVTVKAAKRAVADFVKLIVETSDPLIAKGLPHFVCGNSGLLALAEIARAPGVAFAAGAPLQSQQ